MIYVITLEWVHQKLVFYIMKKKIVMFFLNINSFLEGPNFPFLDKMLDGIFEEMTYTKEANWMDLEISWLRNQSWHILA